MANPTCSNQTLIVDATPFREDSDINPRQQKCLLLYAMVLELAALGGTDYRNTMATTLVSDAASLELGFTVDEMEAALINLGFVRATAAGASVPASIQTKLLNLGNLINVDPLLLDKMFVLLTCRLGVHKAYPQ